MWKNYVKILYKDIGFYFLGQHHSEMLLPPLEQNYVCA